MPTIPSCLAHHKDAAIAPPAPADAASEVPRPGQRHPWGFEAGDSRFSLRDTQPPRDWANVHYAGQARQYYYSLCNHAGAGPVFARDAKGNQTFLTNPQGDRTIYFRRADTGQVWCIADHPAFQPVKDYRCDYTAASTRLQSRFDGVTCSQRVFVPLGQLHEIWTVEVTNHTRAPLVLSVFPYSSVDLQGFPVLFRYGQARMRWTTYHPELQGLFTKNRSPSAPGDIYSAFLISSGKPAAATGQPQSLFTPPFSLARPNLGGGWSDRFVTSYENNCMCLRIDLTLAPGETRRLDFAFGTAPQPAEVESVLHTIREPAVVDRLLAEVEAYHESLRHPVRIDTGDERIDRYVNQWAPKQVESYLAFKQAFRDNLQVDMVYSAFNYERALDNLLDALSHQYEDGHAPHSFRPIIPLHYSDKPAWILLAVPELVKERGDFSILDIELPYIDRHGKPTDFKEPVLDHVRRAMRFLFTDTGRHGMNRMHYADWLDGLDGLSRVGEGESVLTTLMFAAGLREVAALAAARGDRDLEEEALAMHREVAQRVNAVAWEGDRYLRGFSGNGEKVGSKDNASGQLFLNPQSWAIIAGVADASQTRLALASIDAQLETPLGRRLYYPPYRDYLHHIGCISAQPPDYAMNAIYNHACAFSIVAECLAGRGDKAWDVLTKIIPDAAANPVTQSKNEPFAVTNSFKLEPNYYGEAGEAWRTNTAAWTWRGLVEYILGVRKDYHGLRIDPCLPGHLRHATVRRVFRGATYHIRFDNSSGRNRGVRRLAVDGHPIEGNLLPLAPAGAEVSVTVTI